MLSFEQFGQEGRDEISEMLSENQRIQALEGLDEDDSEGEESDVVCIAIVQSKISSNCIK